MLTTAEMDQVCDVLIEHEGLIPWLYCDSLGYVTVGVGDKVTERTVTTMPFVRLSNGAAVDSEAKLAAFARVKAFFHAGLTASAYTACSDLRLSADYCRRRLELRVKSEFVPAVEKHCPQFERFPTEAKLALVDIAYNVGAAGFGKFQTLIARCNARHFGAAARAVHTKKQGEDASNVKTWGRRNMWRYTMMLQAWSATVAIR